MGKGSSKAPSPDPQIGRAALKEAETGEQWLAFALDNFKVSTGRQKEIDALTEEVTRMQMGLAKDQQAYTKTITDRQFGLAQGQADLTKRVTDQQLKQAAWFQDIAKDDRARYEEAFRPAEEAFVKEALGYGSDQRQAQAAAEAKADVLGNAAAARATAAREAASMGVNPASGRFAGIERAGRMETALAAAGAENAARTAVRDKGLALKGDVANFGRGIPAQAAQSAAAGLGASGSALSGAGTSAQFGLQAGNSAIANMGSAATLGIGTAGQGLTNLQNSNREWLASTSLPNAGFQGQMRGYESQAGLLQNQYNSQLDAWKTEQDMAAKNAAGIGSALGSVLGMFSFTSDENLKEDKKAIPEGEALDALKAMPVEEWNYKPGVEDGGRHIGTYAQDFAAATGKGDGRTIPAQDAIGITMKAVQDLDAKVDSLAKQVGLGVPVKKATAKKGASK